MPGIQDFMLVNPPFSSSLQTAPRPLTRIIAGISLARPLNCAMSAFAVLLGAWTVTRRISITILCGMICAALITAGGNTLNDYFDAESDRMNHPQRAIPLGKISREAALWLSWIEIAAGTIAGLSIGILFGSMAILAVLALIAYEMLGMKNAGLPGNVAISYLTAQLFLMGGALAGTLARPCSLAVLAFIASLGREIIKDIEDTRGDISRRTWPMRVGLRRAKITAAILLGIAVALSPMPYRLGILSSWYLPIIVVADLGFLATIFFLFHPIWNASRTAKLAMVSVLAAILAGLLK
jgi:geranylgeranylglycerol-phosphate geranylgeranyltransferase